MCLKGGPKNRKMSPTTKAVNCHSLTHLSYWWRVDTISSISILLGVKFKTLLIHKLYWRSQHSMGQGPGGKNLQNLSHLYSSMNYRSFHAWSSRTLTVTLLLAIRILYSFGPFRGVMKIRIAVTLVVLGYLSIVNSICDMRQLFWHKCAKFLTGIINLHRWSIISLDIPGVLL